jgi:glycosyltransferase involved in cell wall biosynthesis
MMYHPSLRRRHRVAIVGTYPPQECGIATFTMDMVNATDLSGWKSVVIAVDSDGAHAQSADKKVVARIEKESQASYLAAARKINADDISVLSIQHEYGIYGGDDGEYVLTLARAVRCPVVVTLHTIMPEPTPGQRRIIRELERCCDMFVTMAHAGEKLLHEVYGVCPGKIRFIPHGSPYFPLQPQMALKEQFGLAGKRVLSTFGLISPNKGIEDAIAAMPAVVEKVPNALYLILGQTHPVIKRREGEWYRAQLEQQVRDLGMENNIRFVNSYLSLQQLIDYLMATDVYITPYYANPHQITSGTLAYALAAGKVIVSTPYIYAQELLADGRGFLYPFRDSEALAKIAGDVLCDERLFEETRMRAYEYGRTMTWESVGVQYTQLLTEMLREHSFGDRVREDSLSLHQVGDFMAEARTAMVNSASESGKNLPKRPVGSSSQKTVLQG